MDEIILNVNWVAVIVGAIVSFLLGWVGFGIQQNYLASGGRKVSAFRRTKPR